MDPSEVTSILTNAVKSVTDAKVPDDLRAIGFEKAIDLYAGAVVAALSAAAPPAAASTTAGAAPAAAMGSSLDRLATRLRLGRDVVDAVYTESGDTIAVTVPPDKLNKARSIGTREIALLVAAAHQAISDDATTADQIRHVAQDYDRFDGPNYASTLADMKGNFLIGGNSRARTYKLTKPGWAAATALISKIGGADKAAA